MDPWESVQDRDLGRLSPGPSLLRVTAGGKALGSGDRRSCPRADSQRAAKNSAAGSRYVVSCPRERRGQSGESVMGGRCPHTLPPGPPLFLPPPRSAGGFAGAESKGLPLTEPTLCRQQTGKGSGWEAGLQAGHWSLSLVGVAATKVPCGSVFFILNPKSGASFPKP